MPILTLAKRKVQEQRRRAKALAAEIRAEDARWDQTVHLLVSFLQRTDARSTQRLTPVDFLQNACDRRKPSSKTRQMPRLCRICGIESEDVVRCFMLRSIKLLLLNGAKHTRTLPLSTHSRTHIEGDTSITLHTDKHCLRPIRISGVRCWRLPRPSILCSHEHGPFRQRLISLLHPQS